MTGGGRSCNAAIAATSFRSSTSEYGGRETACDHASSQVGVHGILPASEHGRRAGHSTRVSPEPAFALVALLALAVDGDVAFTAAGVDPTAGIVADLCLRVHVAPLTGVRHQQACHRARFPSNLPPSTVQWGATPGQSAYGYFFFPSDCGATARRDGGAGAPFSYSPTPARLYSRRSCARGEWQKRQAVSCGMTACVLSTCGHTVRYGMI